MTDRRTKPDKRASDRTDPAARKRPPQVPDAAFDLWLQRGLHEMFDQVAREPIPPEILDLIKSDRNE